MHEFWLVVDMHSTKNKNAIKSSKHFQCRKVKLEAAFFVINM